MTLAPFLPLTTAQSSSSARAGLTSDQPVYVAPKAITAENSRAKIQERNLSSDTSHWHREHLDQPFLLEQFVPS
jgi:hypothetical protein